MRNESLHHTQKRPAGVVVLAALLTMIAAIGLISSLPALLTTRGIPVAFNAVAVGLSGLLLFNAWGLWTLQKWALLMVRLVLAINVLIVVYNFFVGAVVPVMIFEGVLYAGLLSYTLLDSHLEAAFDSDGS